MEPRPVYKARNSAEASIVQGWLESEGIEAHVFNGEMQGGAFEIIESDPLVLVNEEDFSQAEEIVRRYRTELEQAPDMSRVSDAEGQFDWPICPMCDELRPARCDQCEALGSEFSTEENESGQSQVICLACSQVTTIRYVDKCQYCDHDFLAAADTGSPTDTPSAAPVNNNRVMILVGGFVLLVLLLAGWFFMATR